MTIVGPITKGAIEMADSASLAKLLVDYPENAAGLSDDEKTWRKALKIHYEKKAKEKKDKEEKDKKDKENQGQGKK